MKYVNVIHVIFFRKIILYFIIYQYNKNNNTLILKILKNLYLNYKNLTHFLFIIFK